MMEAAVFTAERINESFYVIDKPNVTGFGEGRYVISICSGDVLQHKNLMVNISLSALRGLFFNH